MSFDVSGDAVELMTDRRGVVAGLVFDMGTRERKTNINYDIDALLRGAPREKKEGAPQQPAVKRGRKLVMPEHQFFDREKYVYGCARLWKPVCLWVSFVPPTTATAWRSSVVAV